MWWHRNRRSVGTVEPEERATAGVAGRGLSGTAGRLRLAAPLRVRHSRREDGNLDRLSRCYATCRRGNRRAARMAEPEGCIRQRLFACSSLKQQALIERKIVEGALASKASCVVLVEASRVPGAGEEEGLLLRRGCGPDGGRCAQRGRQERRHSRSARRCRDRRACLPQHLAPAASRCACSGTASSALSGSMGRPPLAPSASHRQCQGSGCPDTVCDTLPLPAAAAAVTEPPALSHRRR